MSLNLRDYQEKTLSALRDGFKAGHKAQILYLPTGGGKCLGLNTPVLMANGKVKMVQDVIVGDQLLGPDGGIRNVLSLAVGREMLYRITPVKGDSYVVNASHILSLRKTNGHSTNIVNLNVEAFMASDKSQMLKGWRSVPIADKNNNLSFNINAYSVHDISVESIGEGYYYGFEIDGDKLFLLGDFTVTHNTECAIALLDAVKKKGNRSAMILDRIILCDQTSQRLTKYGIDHGVLQSGHWRYRPHEKIQVCSAQTLERRNEFPGLQIMIIDEAHVFRDALKKFIEANPDILVIGLTATPFTKGLGKTFTNVVSTITTKELVDQKVLVPLRVYLAKEIDMTGAKKVAGEWSQEEATTRGIKITGDIVAEWIKKTHEIFGGPRKTIVFCSGVAHGADLAAKFAEQGYNFMPLSYKDSDEFKRDAVEDFKNPDTKIHGLIATDILTRGFDVPDVMIGVSARPFTKSLSSHVQQMGRVMRGHEEKSFAVWLCLAKGSLVLTDSGLIPIDKVKMTHKIWDGTNFITHGGAICNGIRKVIIYQGLTATPGHLVHTAKGWRTFGECASQQIRITQTGFGGKAIRLGDNFRPASFLVGRTAQTIHSCFVRVCDLWIQKLNFACKSSNRENQRVQAMQCPGASLSNVAIQQSAGHEGKMLLFIAQSVFCLRRQRNKVQVLWRETRNALDYAKSWVTGLFFRNRSLTHSIGQNRPEWPLRTGQSSLAFCGAEPAKQKRESIGCSNAQIQNRSSINFICRQHIKGILLGWNDGGRNCGEVQQAFVEAEREVWDILDAGPHNRFTCEGLLVHNCHSGNFLRFREDWDDLFENGVSELDDGKEKTKPEPTEKEKKQSKCPKCGALWLGGDVCSMCGFVRERTNAVSAVPGTMEELTGSASREKKQEWWSQIQWYVQTQGWSPGRGAHLYKDKFGVWPKGLADVAAPPSAEINAFILKKKREYIKSIRRSR